MLYEGPWVAERLAAIEDIVSHNPTLLNETTLKIVSGGAKYTAVDTYRALYKLERLRKEAACVWKVCCSLFLCHIAVCHCFAHFATFWCLVVAFVLPPA